MRRVFMTASAIALLTVCFANVRAADEPECVVDGLKNPCGIAIQPETGVLFVADSGAGRVIRVVDGKIEDAIIGFSKDVYGKGPMYDIGPLGLVFLNKDTLVVGGGENIDDKELLRVYKVPAAGKTIKAEDMVSSFGLEANDVLKAEGNFYGVAASDSAIYVTCNGDDTKGWIAKATIEGGKVTKFERFIATKEATEVDAPVAVAISSQGQVVVGQMGEINVPEDGLLTFYNAKNGEMARNFAVGLSDITALAFSPKNPRLLYAADFAWHDTTQGGLFQLTPKKDGDKQTIETKKLLSLDKPTAMVFGADGALYVTVIGDGNGKLLKIAPGL